MILVLVEVEDGKDVRGRRLNRRAGRESDIVDGRSLLLFPPSGELVQSDQI